MATHSAAQIVTQVTNHQVKEIADDCVTGADGDDKSNSIEVIELNGEKNDDEICLRDKSEKLSDSGSQLTIRLHEIEESEKRVSDGDEEEAKRKALADDACERIMSLIIGEQIKS